MTDWDSERVRALVAAAEDSVQRTRWIFLVLNLACVIMITAQLNLYIPWARNVRNRVSNIIATAEAKAKDTKKAEAGKPEAEQTETQKTEAEAEIIRKKNGEALKTIDKVLWDDLYNVSMPLLGIKYSADDLIVLGTASMSVLALWFVFAHRRESHCIRDLKDIALKTKEQSLKSYIHAAVAHHFVFTTPRQKDVTYESEGIGLALRLPVIFLAHLPWFASFLVVLVMILSLSVPGLELMKVLDDKVAPFLQFTGLEQFEAIIRLVWGLACTALTGYCCFLAQKYHRKTNENLTLMEVEAFGDRKPVKKARRKKRTQGEEQPLDESAAQLQEEKEENDVSGKPADEQQKSSEQRLTAESRRRYLVPLLFASIFIASTTALFIIYRSFTGDGNRVPLSSDPTIWVAMGLAIISAIGTFSSVISTWIHYKKDAREKELKIALLERQLAASSEKPALPISEENQK